MENAKMKLSPPWVTFYHEIEALFSEDTEIELKFDEEARRISMFVDNPAKAEALEQILPHERMFGDVKVTLNVIPSNRESTTFDLMRIAFEGNPVVVGYHQASSPIGDFNYIVFAREVVQFFNDQLDDPYGNKTTLYQEIAKDIFGNVKGVFFCTGSEDED